MLVSYLLVILLMFFSHASGIASLSVISGWKYEQLLVDCHEVYNIYSWSSEGASQWLRWSFGNFSSITIKLTFYLTVKCLNNHWMKFTTDIHGPHRMNLNDLVNSSTFPLVPPCGVFIELSWQLMFVFPRGEVVKTLIPWSNFVVNSILCFMYK